MKKTISGIAAVVALVSAGSASAQVCAGFPTTDGQGTIGAMKNFPTSFDQYGAEGSYNFNGPLAVNAGYIRSTEKGPEDDDDLSSFRAGVALDVSTFPGNFRSTASICPSVRADYSSRDGFTGWQVPIGLGVGASVPVGDLGTTVTLYIIPALIWSHTRGEINDGFNDLVFTDTDTNVGVRAGAELNLDHVYLGITSELVRGPHPIYRDNEAVVGIRAGIRF